MTQAVNSIGTTLMKGVSVVAEIKEINGIDIKAETIDVTTLASTNGYREFLLGFKDAGEVSISGFFYPGDTTGQKAMLRALTVGSIDSYTIAFPTAMGAAWTFDAVVTGFKTGATVEDAVSFEATIKLSGEPILGTTPSTGASDILISKTGGTGLTAYAIVPAFATAKTKYSASYTTDLLFFVKVTALSHTIKMYVDDVFVQTLTTAVEGTTSVAMATVGSKKVTIKCWEASKTPIIYELMVGRVS